MTPEEIAEVDEIVRRADRLIQTISVVKKTATFEIPKRLTLSILHLQEQMEKWKGRFY